MTTETTPETESAEVRLTIAGFLEFLRANALLFAGVAGAMLLTYGLGLTSFTLSIDEETTILANQTLAWLSQGRFTVALFKFLTGNTLAIPFFDLAASLAFLFLATALFAYLFNVASGGRLNRSPVLLLFGVLFTTLPVNAYYLTFNTFNAEVSLGYVLVALAAISSWNWVVGRAGRRHLALAVVFAVLAGGTYQTFGAACGAVLAGAFMLRALAGHGSSVENVRSAIVSVVPIAAAFAVVLVLNSFVAGPGTYLSLYIGWAGTALSEVVFGFAYHVARTLAGRLFYGGEIATVGFVMATLVLLAFAVRLARRGRRWDIPLLLLAVLVAPFLTAFALGNPLPIRAQQALPLALGIALLPLAFVARSWLRYGVGVAVVLVLTWNAVHVSRLFYSEQIAYEHDRDRIASIVSQLSEQGWDGSQVPIVVVGYVERPPAVVVASETFGESFLNWDAGRRSHVIMRALGYPFTSANEEQRRAALEYAATMPNWPADGGVQLVDGVAIVKFAPV